MEQNQKKGDARFPIFQNRLRELQGKMSNTAFADFLGMSRQTVGFYLNGNRVPDILGLTQIAKKCKVSTDWLLGLSEERAINGNLAQACRYTGLSTRSVDKLHELSASSAAHPKALLCVIDSILSDRPNDFITWVWRGAMASCCPKVGIAETELATIRHNADVRLVKAANEGTAKTVELPIDEYEDICMSTAIEIIRESAKDALRAFKKKFMAAFEMEKANKIKPPRC